MTLHEALILIMAVAFLLVVTGAMFFILLRAVERMDREFGGRSSSPHPGEWELVRRRIREEMRTPRSEPQPKFTLSDEAEWEKEQGEEGG